MKNIRVKLVQAHQEQNRNFDVKKNLVVFRDILMNLS